MQNQDLMFVKINLCSNNNDQFLIFVVTFESDGENFHPEMFVNVCQNFIYADELLQEEINNLCKIS